MPFSIIAKVTRDRIMLDYDRKYPQYGFSAHKGYGTELHLEALNKFGVSPIHRQSFAPVGELLLKRKLLLKNEVQHEFAE